MVADAKAGRAGHVASTDPVKGKDAVLFYAPVTTGGWSFVAVAPKDEVLAGVKRLRTPLLVLGLLALVLMGAVLVVVAGRIAARCVRWQPPPSTSARATST